MKRILLFIAVITFISCSKDEENSTSIRVKEYGINVIADSDTEYSYNFFDRNTGEIFHAGINSGSRNIMFQISEKENDIISIEVVSENDIEVFWIAKNGNKYLKKVTGANPDEGVFKMNPLDKNENIYSGFIDVELDEFFWINN